MEKKIVAKFMHNLDNFNGNAKLWILSEEIPHGNMWDDDEPPIGHTKYVVTSAANVVFSGSETYIFPCTEQGKVLDWGELDGSYKGGLDHEQAIENAGW